MSHTTVQLRGYCSRTGYARLDATLGDLCTLYNAALEERIGAYQKAGKSLSLYDQCKSLTHIRREDPDGFGRLHVKAARGALARLDRAFNAFFRRVKAGDKPGYPRFKPRARFVSIELMDIGPRALRRQGKRWVVKAKGLPPITLRPRRALPDSHHLKSLRIVRRPTGCTVDLVYEVEKTPLPPCPAAVGIDMGVRKRMTLSTGEKLGRAQTEWDAIKHQQQKVARCQRGSNTRKKQVKQLARLRRRQAVQNRNACHRITTDLVRRYGLIAVEALKISNMTRSAKGTVVQPGTKVAQKRGLNRSIQEQTWGLLRQQLAYKAAWAGREFVEVPPQYTSQECSGCGHPHDPGTAERYRCPACGLDLDRDVNAARNILRAGTLALAARQKYVRD